MFLIQPVELPNNRRASILRDFYRVLSFKVVSTVITFCCVVWRLLLSVFTFECKHISCFDWIVNTFVVDYFAVYASFTSVSIQLMNQQLNLRLFFKFEFRLQFWLDRCVSLDSCCILAAVIKIRRIASRGRAVILTENSYTCFARTRHTWF